MVPTDTESQPGEMAERPDGGAGPRWRALRACVIIALASTLVWLSVARMPAEPLAAGVAETASFRADIFLVRGPVRGGGTAVGESGEGEAAGEFDVIDLETESADRLTRLVVERSEDLLRAEIAATAGLAGPGHRFRRVEVQRMELTPLREGAAWERGELERAREKAAAWAMARAPGAVSAELAAGDVNRTRLMTRGVALNVGTLALVAVIVWQAVWLPGAVLADRARRRAGRGLCPACGYEIGAEPGELAKCPECGAALAAARVA